MSVDLLIRHSDIEPVDVYQGPEPDVQLSTESHQKSQLDIKKVQISEQFWMSTDIKHDPEPVQRFNRRAHVQRSQSDVHILNQSSNLVKT